MKHKSSNCEHQFDNVITCAPAYENHYHCHHCNAEWIDEWSCQCDSDCPSCGCTFTPYESCEVSDCACNYL